jgi:hypothetical protein
MAKSGIQADEGKAAHPLDRVVWNALSGPNTILARAVPMPGATTRRSRPLPL